MSSNFIWLASLLCSLSLSGRGSEYTHLRFLGHASFELTSFSGTRIVVDPYGNSLWSHWFDRPFPRHATDIVIVTHGHFDHNAIDRVGGRYQLIRHVGTVQGKDYVIRSIDGLHARPHLYGTENRVLILELNGIRFCHWGDNGAQIDEQMLSVIGPVDVLMLPVDESEHLLTLTEVTAIIRRLSPKVVIPMHYFIPGITSPCSTLQPIDAWLTRNTVRTISSEGVRLTRSVLPSSQEVWLFMPDAMPRRVKETLKMRLPCFVQSQAVFLTCVYLLFGLITGALGIFSGILLHRMPPILSQHPARALMVAVLFWPVVLVLAACRR